jgi:hypothetical protein
VLAIPKSKAPSAPTLTPLANQWKVCRLCDAAFYQHRLSPSYGLKPKTHLVSDLVVGPGDVGVDEHDGVQLAL